MVAKIYGMLDRDGSGSVSVSDVINVFDVSLNPEFIERKKTKDQIVGEFLNGFEGARGNKDGKITKEEFFDYYTDISMLLPSDEYFVRMMESTWQCPEQDADMQAKSTVRMLLKEVRNRVLDLSKNDPKLLRKIHSDFDLNQSGSLTIDEIIKMIAKLKISVERRYVYPFFKIIDNDNSGGIEYEEFENYIDNNPF